VRAQTLKLKSLSLFGFSTGCNDLMLFFDSRNDIHYDQMVYTLYASTDSKVKFVARVGFHLALTELHWDDPNELMHMAIYHRS